MQVIAIVAIIMVTIFIIYEMNKSQEVLKSQWFKDLDRNDKIKITGSLKKFWMNSIILMSLLICWLFIIISTFMGKGTDYEFQVCISAIVYSLITIVFVLLFNKKYYSSINNFIR